MTSDPASRQIFIVEDQPSIHNLLYLFLSGLGSEGEAAHDDKQALAIMGQESFDAVLLDLRCSSLAAGEVAPKIKGVRLSMVGRVLVINGEVSDPETMQAIERQCRPRLPKNRRFKDLWNILKPILGIAHKTGPSIQ